MITSIKSLWQYFQIIPNLLRDLGPLALRLILAYGFFEPALKKLGNIQGTAQWFESLGYPFPLLNVYLAMGTELSGVVLLTLGLATRLISIPLMFTMLIAITTVHWSNGFSCGDNGIQIPFYFFFMLFSLFLSGPGRLSVDNLIARKFGSL